MPTVGLDRDHLFERLGKSFSQEEFELLCFEFGIELDDVTSEAESAREMGMKEEEAAKLSTRVIYRIDVPANRYDILCMEGMARALRIFLGEEPSPEYKLREPKLTMRVAASTARVRPFVACAVLRNVSFEDERVYQSFLDLQDKLHQNICRRRTLVAIGTHDLDALTPPFAYEALEPQTIEFVPLTEESKVFKARDLLDHYRVAPECKHLKPYANIVYDSPVYPVIKDSTGLVLSLPPVINGRPSRIQPHTKDVFIECTATDETKANVVCDTLVAMFSEYCGFEVEAVKVVYDDREDITPKLSSRQCTASLDTVRKTIGLTESDLSGDDAARLCEKMQLAPATCDGDVLTVTVPCTRSDILHAVDVAEDVAIAYGYNNLRDQLPATNSVGGPTAQNLFCDLLRDEIARAGFVEILTHGLCRTDENYDKLLLPRRDDAVGLLNPASDEFEQVRTTLLVGALKTLQHNKRHSLAGLKLFEVSDVVLKDPNADVGAVNVRKLVATYTGQSAGFEVIHGLLDRVMACAQIAPSPSYADLGKDDENYSVPHGTSRYTIQPCDRPTFFPGRSADVLLLKPDGSSQVIGTFGVIHPKVLANFDLDYPTSTLELNVDDLRLAD